MTWTSFGLRLRHSLRRTPHFLDSQPSSRAGTWLYANETPLRVRIVRHHTLYGTGDDADEPLIAEDQSQETYYVLYQVAGSSVSWAGGASASSLDEASSLAELALGLTLKWGAA